MANTLTSLIPTLYESLDVVSRELVGFIPSVALDANAARAAVNQSILVPITPASVAADVVPGVTAPNDGDQVIGNTPIVISKSRAVPFRWNGEDQRGINSGPGYANLKRDQIVQAMRTLTNEVEADLAAKFIGASRAYGTAGTTPFATDLSATANVLKVLLDNGCPQADLSLVIDTTAGAKMRTLTQLTKANEAASDSLLRQGVLLDVHGFAIRESAGVKSVTKGAGAAYTSNTAGYAVGATAITLITGSGAVNAGDVVTFAGDSNQYVVSAGVAAPGVLTLAAPGLKQALPASAVALTVGGNYTANMAFNRNAIVLVTRAPALPEEGDMADDRMIVTDPRSGLSFEVAMYRQYRQVRYELSLAWGAAVIKSAHTALLLG
jgi:hypothetical protein